MVDSAWRERQAGRPDGPLRLRFAEKRLLLGSFSKRNSTARLDGLAGIPRWSRRDRRDAPAGRSSKVARMRLATAPAVPPPPGPASEGRQRGGQSIALTPALTGDFGEHHPGGHRGIQRFGLTGHRDGTPLRRRSAAPTATTPCLPIRRPPPAGRSHPGRLLRCHRRRPVRPPAVRGRPNP